MHIHTHITLPLSVTQAHKSLLSAYWITQLGVSVSVVAVSSFISGMGLFPRSLDELLLLTTSLVSINDGESVTSGAGTGGRRSGFSSEYFGLFRALQ